MKKLRRAFGSLINISTDGVDNSNKVFHPSPRRSITVALSASASTAGQSGTYISFDNQSLHNESSVVNYIDPLNTEDKLFTKLHKWAYVGDLAKIKKFSKKIDVNAEDSEGRTALHLCSSAGHAEVLLHLLSAQANTEVRDRDGRTPLFRASERGHIDIVQILLQHQVDINVKDSVENTVLHIAAQTGARDIAELLLDYGLDCEACNTYGQTPLHVAAANLQTDVVKLLLSREVDVNAEDKDGVTPVMMVVKKGCRPLTDFLIEAGADISQQDCSGWTAASYARYAGYNDLHKHLVKLMREESDSGLMVSSVSDGMLGLSTNLPEKSSHSKQLENTSLEDAIHSKQLENTSFEDVPLDATEDSWKDDSEDNSGEEKQKIDIGKFIFSDSENSSASVPQRRGLSTSSTSLGPPKPPQSITSSPVNSDSVSHLVKPKNLSAEETDPLIASGSQRQESDDTDFSHSQSETNGAEFKAGTTEFLGPRSENNGQDQCDKLPDDRYVTKISLDDHEQRNTDESLPSSLDDMSFGDECDVLPLGEGTIISQPVNTYVTQLPMYLNESSINAPDKSRDINDIEGASENKVLLQSSTEESSLSDEKERSHLQEIPRFEKNPVSSSDQRKSLTSVSGMLKEDEIGSDRVETVGKFSVKVSMESSASSTASETEVQGAQLSAESSNASHMPDIGKEFHESLTIISKEGPPRNNTSDNLQFVEDSLIPEYYIADKHDATQAQAVNELAPDMKKYDSELASAPSSLSPDINRDSATLQADNVVINIYSSTVMLEDLDASSGSTAAKSKNLAVSSNSKVQRQENFDKNLDFEEVKPDNRHHISSCSVSAEVENSDMPFQEPLTSQQLSGTISHGTLGRTGTLQQIDEMWEANASLVANVGSSEETSEASETEGLEQKEIESTSASLKKRFFGDSKENLFADDGNINCKFSEEKEIKDMEGVGVNTNYAMVKPALVIVDVDFCSDVVDDDVQNYVQTFQLPQEKELETLVRKLRILLNKEHLKNENLTDLISELEKRENFLVEEIEKNELKIFQYQEKVVKLQAYVRQVEYESSSLRHQSDYAQTSLTEILTRTETLENYKEHLQATLMQKEYTVARLEEDLRAIRNVCSSLKETKSYLKPGISLEDRSSQTELAVTHCSECQTDVQEETNLVVTQPAKTTETSSQTSVDMIDDVIQTGLNELEKKLSIGTQTKSSYLNTTTVNAQTDTELAENLVRCASVGVQSECLVADMSIQTDLNLQYESDHTEADTRTQIDMTQSAVQTDISDTLFVNQLAVNINQSVSQTDEANVENFGNLTCIQIVHRDCQTELDITHSSIQTVMEVSDSGIQTVIEVSDSGTQSAMEVSDSGSQTEMEVSDSGIQTELEASHPFVPADKGSRGSIETLPPDGSISSVALKCMAAEVDSADSASQTDNKLIVEYVNADCQTFFNFSSVQQKQTQTVTVTTDAFMQTVEFNEETVDSEQKQTHAEQKQTQTVTVTTDAFMQTVEFNEETVDSGQKQTHAEQKQTQTVTVTTDAFIQTVEFNEETVDSRQKQTHAEQKQTQTVTVTTDASIQTVEFNEETVVSRSAANKFYVTCNKGTQISDDNIFCESAMHGTCVEYQNGHATSNLPLGIGGSREALRELIQTSINEVQKTNQGLMKELMLNTELSLKSHEDQLLEKFTALKTIFSDKMTQLELQITDINKADFADELRQHDSTLSNILQHIDSISQLESIVKFCASETLDILKENAVKIDNLKTDSVEIPKQLTMNLNQGLEEMNSSLGNKIAEQNRLLTNDSDVMDNKLYQLESRMKLIMENILSKDAFELKQNIGSLVTGYNDTKCILNGLQTNRNDLMTLFQQVTSTIEEGNLESHNFMSKTLKTLISSLDETISENFQIVQNLLQNFESNLIRKVNEMQTFEHEGRYGAAETLSKRLEELYKILSTLQISLEAKNELPPNALFDSNIIEAIRGGNEQALISLQFQNEVLLKNLESCRNVLNQLFSKLLENDGSHEPTNVEILEELNHLKQTYDNQISFDEKFHALELKCKELQDCLQMKNQYIEKEMEEKKELETKLEVLIQQKREREDEVISLNKTNSILLAGQRAQNQVLSGPDNLIHEGSYEDNFHAQVQKQNFNQLSSFYAMKEQHSLERELKLASERNMYLSKELKRLEDACDRKEKEYIDNVQMLKLKAEDNEARIQNLQKRLLQSELANNKSNKTVVTEDLENIFFEEIQTLKDSKQQLETVLREKKGTVLDLKGKVSELEIERQELQAELGFKSSQVFQLKKETSKQWNTIFDLKQQLTALSVGERNVQELEDKLTELESEVASKHSLVLNLRERLTGLAQEKGELTKQLASQRGDNVCVEALLQEKGESEKTMDNLKQQLGAITQQITDDCIPKSKLESVYSDVQSYFEDLMTERKKQWASFFEEKLQKQENRIVLLKKRENDLKIETQSLHDQNNLLKSKLSLLERNSQLWRSRYNELFREYYKVDPPPEVTAQNIGIHQKTHNRDLLVQPRSAFKPSDDKHSQSVTSPPNDKPFQKILNDIDHMLKIPYEDSSFVSSISESSTPTLSPYNCSSLSRISLPRISSLTPDLAPSERANKYSFLGTLASPKHFVTECDSGLETTPRATNSASYSDKSAFSPSVQTSYESYVDFLKAKYSV